MTSPANYLPAQDFQPNGYPVWQVIDGNLSILDPTNTGAFGNLYAQNLQASGPFTNVKAPPFGATGGGVIDDTPAIMAAIKATPSGGVIYFPPGTYLFSQPLIMSSGQAMYSARALAPPASPRDANAPAPSILKATATFSWQPVTMPGEPAGITDTAYSSNAANPLPSSDIQIVGMDLDMTLAPATVNGIALVTQASSVMNNRIRNPTGTGILLTDTSAAGNTTTGGPQAALNENFVSWNRVEGPGVTGIWIQSVSGSLGTDGFMLFNVVDGNFINSGPGITSEISGDWKIIGNHIYALQADGFHILRASGGTVVDSNFVDNFGLAVAASTIYYGMNLQSSPFGTPKFVNNHVSTKEAGSPASTTFNYYRVTATLGGQNLDVFFASSNSARQISAGSGTHTAYSFDASTGNLTVRGITSPLMEVIGSASPSIAYPVLANGPVFTDFKGSPVTYGSIGAPTPTASTTLVMAGLNLSFTAALTGKVKITLLGGVKTGGTPPIGGSIGLRFASTSFTAGNPVSGTQVGKDQSVAISSASFPTPFTLAFEVGGLAIGTATFFDLAYDTSNAADTAAPVNLWAMIEETY